ncbi:hypothetical protein ACQKJ1_05255 [Methylorubrum rhodesianum]
MTHRSLRLCAILGAVGLSAFACATAMVGTSVWDAARGGRLVTMPWSAAR